MSDPGVPGGTPDDETSKLAEAMVNSIDVSASTSQTPNNSQIGDGEHPRNIGAYVYDCCDAWML